MKSIRKRLTYANVMSSIAVFLVIGGASAFAAVQLGRYSVGTRQLKRSSVTAAKLKRNAVNAAKIRRNAVTTPKIRNGAVNGAKVDEGSLGTVPNSATTDAVKSSKGTVALGQQATAFEHGPVKLVVRCKPYEANEITAQVYIESSADGTTFVSWRDGGKALGPGTPDEEREVTAPFWSASNGPFSYDSPSDAGVSATAADGSSFTAFVGVAAEKDTGTCWYWTSATIIS